MYAKKARGAMARYIVQHKIENLEDLKQYNVDNGPIHLHIQSFGGSLFHTLYLIDLIKNM